MIRVVFLNFHKNFWYISFKLQVTILLFSVTEYYSCACDFWRVFILLVSLVWFTIPYPSHAAVQVKCVSSVVLQVSLVKSDWVCWRKWYHSLMPVKCLWKTGETETNIQKDQHFQLVVLRPKMHKSFEGWKLFSQLHFNIRPVPKTSLFLPSKCWITFDSNECGQSIWPVFP